MKICARCSKKGPFEEIQGLFGKIGDFENLYPFRGDSNLHFKTCPEEIGQLGIKLWATENV